MTWRPLSAPERDRFRFGRWIVKRADGTYTIFDGRWGYPLQGPYATTEEACYHLANPGRFSMESETEVAEVVVTEPAAPEAKPRRKRRTKEEIAAANGTAIVPSNEPDTAIALWEQEAKDLLGKLALAVIESQDEMNEAGDIKRAAFEKQKQLEAERKDLKAPVLEAGRRIDNKFKPALGYCQAIQDACEKLIVTFRLKAAAEQDAALKAIADSGGTLADESTLVVAHGAEVLALPDTVREVVTYTWRVTDAGAVPDVYWHRVLNAALIEGIVKEKGFAAQQDIPGILIERQIGIANKASRG